MQIYLPIAELSINVFLLLGMGGAVGFLSGMFGVGGGFLMTPLLIFTGVAPAVAVATGANQIVASSVSGVLVQWKRKSVDFKMGSILLAGGMVGSLAGVLLFRLLIASGLEDLFISLFYVVFLGIIGSLMFAESLRTIRRAHSSNPLPHRKPRHHNWIHGLPLRVRFPVSGLYISCIPPLILGFLVGILAAIMGVGGGFIMLPAMIYLLRMPAAIAIGTSLFQIIFVAAITTILHATTNHTVDFVLAFLLLLGGVVGAQFGARAGQRLKSEELRALLALLVLGVCLRLGVDLVVTPIDLFSLDEMVGQ